MVSRTAFAQLKNSITILLLSIFGLIILYLIFPFIIILSLFNFEILNFLLALIGYFIISVIYLPTIKFYNLSKFNALLLPFSALIYIFITLNSAINYFLGFWKRLERKKILMVKITEDYIRTLISKKSFNDENFPVSSFLIDSEKAEHKKFLSFCKNL